MTRGATNYAPVYDHRSQCHGLSTDDRDVCTVGRDCYTKTAIG